MSKTTKRKHVTKEALTEYYIPEGEEEIVKIINGRGNNLHEVEASNGKKFLVSMPTKFRKNLWIKRGDFVVVNPIKEGNKVLAEITYVLYSKQIKYLQQEGLWPEGFIDRKTGKEGDCKTSSSEVESESSTYGDDDLLFENPNRKQFDLFEDSENTSSEDEECARSDKHYESEDNLVSGSERNCEKSTQIKVGEFQR